MAEVRRYPRLSEDEERRLGRAVREAGDMDAARRLVVHNLRLVMSIANHYRRAWANILDLFQEGSVGLMEAVKRWKPSLGPRFGSYAAYWIRAYLLKFLMTNSRLIHVGNTRAGRKLFFRLEKARQQLLARASTPRRCCRRRSGTSARTTWKRWDGTWTRARWRSTRAAPRTRTRGTRCPSAYRSSRRRRRTAPPPPR